MSNDTTRNDKNLLDQASGTGTGYGYDEEGPEHEGLESEDYESSEDEGYFDGEEAGPTKIGDLTEEEWLELSRGAYRTSTDFFDSSLRKQIEKNLSYFRSKHPSGSKYHSESYRFRSKNFRPKTRSAITRNEAQAAVAFFSTSDLVAVEPQNDADEAQRIAADLNNELLNYRLTETIPWFLTCIGAFQDAMTVGAVVSKQHWVYEERDVQEFLPMVNPKTGEGLYTEDGEPVMELRTKTKVLKDEPAVDLIPIENVRFDPSADWRNVAGTSPYWITLIPMYLGDVKGRMNQVNDKTGQPKWRPADDDILLSATKLDNDSIRQARSGNTRQDAFDHLGREGDFQIVWVREVILKHNGQDWIYYTLGGEHLLTDPTPLEDVYFHGKRPYVMGYCLIETHRVPPSGAPEIWEGMQNEINDISNQRLDNVRLVLNTRYFARREGNVDTRALKHSIPGSVVLMDDINSDVRADRPADVTASSYQEQDRLNVDFDEIAGSFSPGSVQSNRQLNETVGGMEMLSSDSNALTEYRLRIFSETWVEPVLRQLIALEQAYETDETILTIAGQRADVFNKLGIDRVPDGLLELPVKTSVNVGLGNTNPRQRVEKLGMAFNTLGMLIQFPDVEIEEVKKEVFGALGYKDGARFFKGDQQDPEKEQLKQMVRELQAQLEGKQAEIQGRIQVAQIAADSKIQVAQMQNETKQQIEYFKARIAETEKKLQAATLKANNDIEVGKLLNQREALIFQMRIKEAELSRSNQEGRLSQTIMNDRYGNIPGQEG